MPLFIIIPSLLIIGSLAGIGFIIYRKIPYLKKLEVSGVESFDGNGDHRFNWQVFVNDIFPEGVSFAKGIHLKEYKDLWLLELEKLLRRFRLWSLKLDTAFEALIKKLRTINKKAAIKAVEPVSPVLEIKTEPARDITEIRLKSKLNRTPEAIKQEEQRLIIEIAKTPKDAVLYEKLGELYIEMGGWADAKQSFEAAVELDPDNEKLKKRLSFVLEKVTLMK